MNPKERKKRDVCSIPTFKLPSHVHTKYSSVLQIFVEVQLTCLIRHKRNT